MDSPPDRRATTATTTTRYKYTTLSGKLVRVEYNTTILDIVYDESGQPFSIRYKSSPTATGALYYYVLNAQDDVVGLLNSSGELVVEYKYDPWGKLLETIIGVDETDSKYAAYNNMGLRNPLRYRGYIYDREGDLYDHTVRVEFHHFIRDERKFSGVDELKAQILRDAETTREYFAKA